MLLKFYRYCNLLSLDVAIGACICSVYLSRLMLVNIPWLSILVLGLTVWLIYTFDHLQDAKKINDVANTERHKFHQKNFSSLTIISALVLVLIAILIFYLPVTTVVMGAALACFVVAYFIILHFLGLNSSYHKEILIAIIYASGIFLAPMSIYDGAIELVTILIFGQFVNLALINLLIFSWLERDKDRVNGFPSLVNIVGGHWSKRLIIMLIGLQLALSLFMVIRFGIVDVSLIIVTMTAILGGIAFFSEYFYQNERYRLIGDFVFLIPIIGLI